MTALPDVRTPAADTPGEHPTTGLPGRAAILAICARPDRLALAAQPIIDAANGVVVGFELLSRFPFAYPDQWFAAANRLGLGPALDALVIKRGIESRGDLPPNTFLSINVEPASLLDPSVGDVLRAAGDLSRIVIELTEHARLTDIEATRAVLDELRRAGAMIAADDVGAGYAGLQALLHLRPEIVKIDRSLVDGLDTEPSKQALIAMLGEVAGQMDAWILAEGVERGEELRELVRMGVPLVQGYFLARPGPGMPTDLPADAVEIIQTQRDMVQAEHAVLSLMEPLPVVPVIPGGPVEGDTCIEVDAWGRPCTVVIDGRRLGSPMTVQSGEHIAHVAARVAGRGVELEPVVVVNGRGQALGVVTPRALLSRLAASDER